MTRASLAALIVGVAVLAAGCSGVVRSGPPLPFPPETAPQRYDFDVVVDSTTLVEGSNLLPVNPDFADHLANQLRMRQLFRGVYPQRNAHLAASGHATAGILVRIEEDDHYAGNLLRLFIALPTLYALNEWLPLRAEATAEVLVILVLPGGEMVRGAGRDTAVVEVHSPDSNLLQRAARTVDILAASRAMLAAIADLEGELGRIDGGDLVASR